MASALSAPATAKPVQEVIRLAHRVLTHIIYPGQIVPAVVRTVAPVLEHLLLAPAA